MSRRIQIDKVTDALVQAQLERCRPPVTFNSFVEGAIHRELDRLALVEREKGPPTVDRSDMWEIIIPWPRRS